MKKFVIVIGIIILIIGGINVARLIHIHNLNHGDTRQTIMDMKTGTGPDIKDHTRDKWTIEYKPGRDGK